jgi:hypothetical protein
VVPDLAWFPMERLEAACEALTAIGDAFTARAKQTTTTTITTSESGIELHGITTTIAPPPGDSRGITPPVKLHAVNPALVNLGKAERAVLAVLAQYPQGRTHSQIALLTGYRPTASTIGVALSKLRRAGWVTPGGIPQATPEGVVALGGDYEPLPSGRELLQHWLGEIGKAERAILQLMIDDPRQWTHAELAAATGYSPDASTIGVALSKLRKLELVDGWQLHTDFREAIR